jgi:osmoprotectant transport system permease protein
VRTSATNVIATATLAALVAQGGLGRLIVDGQVNDNSELVAGAILVAVLAIVADLVLAGTTQLFSPVARAGAPGRIARLRRARRPDQLRAEPVGA